eukprot:CAMPEP_0201959760 /NCGR_PEP_ID=MMETSP0904-20121228/6622_1 /ASSEMBLY_ACC=CAM_ASM_000553 /TAXON_ID=420261 /ORGANISM="Thalassiosira antarctica, Strain CCMP982" /LENGTH=351 /DNA_ID=CAMNT_0048505489 /DNA_START=153 /DNA_END=1205 /DNA_ORIENTATION=-
MGQIRSICGFRVKPQQATAHVETSLRDIQACNAPFFLYTEGTIVPRDVTRVCVDPSITVIPESAFRSRHRLKEVVLPEGLQEIGGGAFRSCVSLERINFPFTLTAIGAHAFDYCTSLREVDLLSNNVTTIGTYAFCGCRSLERIHFPFTLTAIGNWAFCDCLALRELNLVGGILDIGEYAFMNCQSLERVEIPSTDVTDIGGYVFDGCVSLREVKLVGGILDIGKYAFSRCSSLEQIAIPFKAFVIEKIAGAYHSIGANRNCHLLTDGAITSMEPLGQVVIASECLNYMSLTGLVEVENAINNAINNDREQTTEEIFERIHALFAYYELVKATTMLELALWKANMDECDAW